jgi:hypothetical protein
MIIFTRSKSDFHIDLDSILILNKRQVITQEFQRKKQTKNEILNS